MPPTEPGTRTSLRTTARLGDDPERYTRKQNTPIKARMPAVRDISRIGLADRRSIRVVISFITSSKVLWPGHRPDNSTSKTLLCHQTFDPFRDSSRHRITEGPRMARSTGRGVRYGVHFPAGSSNGRWKYNGETVTKSPSHFFPQLIGLALKADVRCSRSG